MNASEGPHVLRSAVLPRHAELRERCQNCGL